MKCIFCIIDEIVAKKNQETPEPLGDKYWALREFVLTKGFMTHSARKEGFTVDTLCEHHKDEVNRIRKEDANKPSEDAKEEAAMAGYVEGRGKNEILTALYDTAEPGSRVHEQQKMGILVRCTEDMERVIGSLEQSMNENARASDKLATKVFWLNVILAIATVVGTILAIAK